MTRRIDRRELRDRPYLPEHLDSTRQREPRTLPELLHWFLEGFAAETPEVMHARGVWVDRPKRDELGVRVRGTGQGGSLLGSPATAEPFRQLLENTPRQVAEDDDGATFYVRPMRAALERLAGNTEGSDSAFMARFLVQVAYGGGDWEAVASRWKIQPFLRSVYLETALRRLHRLYRAEPTTRAYASWLDRSDAQRAAELAEVNGTAPDIGKASVALVVHAHVTLSGPELAKEVERQRAERLAKERGMAG